MQKRNWLLSFITALFAINFVSAYPRYYSYGYGGFSLGTLLDALEPSTVFLTCIFFISFGFIYFSLIKFFKGNAVIAGIVAFSVSLLITYGLHLRGFDVGVFFYDIGFAVDEFAPLILIIFVGFAVFASFKWGAEKTLFSIGVFFILISVFGWVYETGLLAVIGTIMVIISGIIFGVKNKAKPRYPWER